VRILLSGRMGRPEKIIVFSRDEAKQHYMRLEYMNQRFATDDVIYRNFQELLTFRIGDVRDFHAIASALHEADVVFHAAALKQVPTCEYFPFEAVLTNVTGAENIVRAIREYDIPVDTVVGISTDKACKPINVMGMTKAIQERVLIHANIECKNTRFICVRYGNVISSRGSVVPLFLEQIRNGGPVTITTPEMTRFLLTLDKGADTIFTALQKANRGETYIPRIGSAKVTDVAKILIGDRPIKTEFVGIRPGEKTHEILISEEEAHRVAARGGYYAIQPILPELRTTTTEAHALSHEYSSAENLMPLPELKKLISGTRLHEEQSAEG